MQFNIGPLEICTIGLGNLIGVSPSPGGKPISVGDLWNYVIPPRTAGVVLFVEFVGLLKGPTCREHGNLP